VTLMDDGPYPKSGYKRPSNIQRIFSRSRAWENTTHHKIEGPVKPIKIYNYEVEANNATQAAHDRMHLRVYAGRMEKNWQEEKLRREQREQARQAGWDEANKLRKELNEAQKRLSVLEVRTRRGIDEKKLWHRVVKVCVDTLGNVLEPRMMPHVFNQTIPLLTGHLHHALREIIIPYEEPEELPRPSGKGTPWGQVTQ